MLTTLPPDSLKLFLLEQSGSLKLELVMTMEQSGDLPVLMQCTSVNFQADHITHLILFE